MEVFSLYVGKWIRKLLSSGGHCSRWGRCRCCFMTYELYPRFCQTVKTSLITLVSNKFREPKGTVLHSFVCRWCLSTRWIFVMRNLFLLAWRTEKGCPIKFWLCFFFVFFCLFEVERARAKSDGTKLYCPLIAFLILIQCRAFGGKSIKNLSRR